MRKNPRVVFVSRNGPARAQMAAALLAATAGDFVDVRFFIENGSHVDDEVLASLAEVELDDDVDRLATTGVPEKIDLIVVIDRLACSETTINVEPSSLPRPLASRSPGPGSTRIPPILSWPVEDPALVRDAKMRRHAYRRARFELSEHIEVLVGQGYLGLLLHAVGVAHPEKGVTT